MAASAVTQKLSSRLQLIGSWNSFDSVVMYQFVPSFAIPCPFSDQNVSAFLGKFPRNSR